MAKLGDTIQFSNGLAGTISLTSGELLVNKSITIVGATTSDGAPAITINGGFNSRVFDIEGGANGISVTLDNLIVMDGFANSQAANVASAGGGLLIKDAAGTVTLDNLDITNNGTWGATGTNGAFSQPGGAGQNSAGGGLAFFGGSSAKLVLTNTSVSGNDALGGQGGMGGAGGTAGSITYNSQTGQYSKTLTLTNISSLTLSGPIAVSLTGLPAGVTLVNANGVYNNDPFVNILNSSGKWLPGHVLKVTLKFKAPSASSITYGTEVLQGI